MSPEMGARLTRRLSATAVMAPSSPREWKACLRGRVQTSAQSRHRVFAIARFKSVSLSRRRG